jgi:predicted metalloprotease with PDZ domain
MAAAPHGPFRPLLARLAALVAALSGSLGAAQAAPDPTIGGRYVVALDRAAERWRVTATFDHGGGPFEAWFQRWTPGAYHLAEYGASVETIAARDGDGRDLTLERDGASRLLVPDAPPGQVVLDYVAAPCAQRDVNDRMILSVEGTRIADRYAYVSPNALLCFRPGQLDLPCEVRYELPPGWTSASALPEDPPATYHAPSWWRLEDSPALFSPSLETATFEVGGIPHAVTIHGAASGRAEELAGRCRRLALAAGSWMLRLPYPRYHYLLVAVPGELGGAGLEHSDSTLIVTGEAMLELAEYDHLLAHEYFHAWCAERIKVAALVRPDFTAPLRTGTLWANEGITEYFCRHLLVSAGLRTRAEFFAELSQQGREARMMRPMIGELGWTEIARAAPDWDDIGDLMQFSARHYPAGCFTVFALDLEMRAASGGERGIADLLRLLMTAYADRERGYGEEELKALVAGVAQSDLDPFFARHIDGADLPTIRERLALIGFTTRGGMQEIVPLPEPTEAQRAALEDLFTPPPALARR